MAVNQYRYDGTPDPFYGYDNFERVASLPLKTSREISASPVGIGMETLDRDTFNPEHVYDLLEKTGVKWARVQTGWLKCEKEEGVYNFKWLDSITDNLLKRGIQPWFSVSFGNPLYTPNPQLQEFIRENPGKQIPGHLRGCVGEVPLYHGERATEAFLAFAQEIARHFGSRVHHYEIWNEPSGISNFWRFHGLPPYPEVSSDERMKRCAADYVELVRRTGNAIRAVLPDAKIISCHTDLDSNYQREAALNGLNSLIDIASVHMYKNFNQAFDSVRLNVFRNIMHPRELWMGEGGAVSGMESQHPSFGATEYTQAKSIARRLVTDVGLGCRVSSIYCASDLKAYWHDGSDSLFGIIHANGGGPKLACSAIRAIATLFEDIEPADDLALIPVPCHLARNSSVMALNAMQTFAFRKKGSPIFAWYVAERETISAEPFLFYAKTALLPEDGFTDPVIVDPLRLNVYRVKKHQTSMHSSFMADLVCADYPLFLTDYKTIFNS